MKKLLSILLFFALTLQLKAQEQQNIADLDFLYQAIKQLPSYKDQLKNDASYTQLYQQLQKEMNTADDFEVFKKLAQLIYPIKDNHLGFYRSADSTYKFKFLKAELPTADLIKKLEQTPKDSIEGLYYFGTKKYIIFQKAGPEYHVQSVESGIITAILIKNKFGSFDCIQFLNPPSSYMIRRNVKLINDGLIGLGYRKTKETKYNELGKTTELYEYRDLNEKVGYLRLSSFSSSNTNIKKATDFFDSVKSKINTQNLIVDLRSNTGGGYKTSGQFISYLTRYSGKIYLLQNAYTMSNAEQFIIRLKDQKNVVTLGERSSGMITYGSNYGNTLSLPSKRFSFYPTDMNGSSKELAYESVGVHPGILLDPYLKDWIAQTLEKIK